MRMIDADALLDDVRSHCESYFADDFASEWVDKQPTVDAVPVRYGRWKYDENGMDWNMPAWICSECGFRNDMIPALVKDVNGRVEFQNPLSWSGSRYCANCGARMDVSV